MLNRTFNLANRTFFNWKQKRLTTTLTIFRWLAWCHSWRSRRRRWEASPRPSRRWAPRSRRRATWRRRRAARRRRSPSSCATWAATAKSSRHHWPRRVATRMSCRRPCQRPMPRHSSGRYNLTFWPKQNLRVWV